MGHGRGHLRRGVLHAGRGTRGRTAPAGTAGVGYLLGFAALFVFSPYALYRAFRRR